MHPISSLGQYCSFLIYILQSFVDLISTGPAANQNPVFRMYKNKLTMSGLQYFYWDRAGVVYHIEHREPHTDNLSIPSAVLTM